MSRLPANRLILVSMILLLPSAGRANEKYALLIGVRQYPKSQLRSLNYSEADIVGLAGALHNAGYRPENVVLMTQTLGAENSRFMPVYANIRKELRLLLRHRGPTDTVLIALAGHGIQFRGTREPYFCPMDADLHDKTTLIGLNEVYQELEQSRALVRLLIDDSCRNDPQAEQSRAQPEEDVERVTGLPEGGALFSFRAAESGPPRRRTEVDLESVTRPQDKQPPRGVIALFSCATGQKAYESDRLKHGVFFHFVIEALQGKADFDSDKEVTLEEMELYTAKRVKDFVRKEYDEDQVPCHSGEAPGALVLVKLSGPKGSSLGVATQDVDFQLAQRLGLARPVGVQVQGVLPDLAGAKAGLRAGDVLLTVDGAAIPDHRRLEAALARYRAGDSVTLEVLRAGERVEVKAVLGAELSREELARRYERAAKDGEAWAQYELGRMYALGDGLPVDDRAATRWYRRAADQGLAAAQYMLAVRYVNGQGVEKDDAEAFRWSLRAAEKGLASAQYWVGLMYRNGWGVERDDAEAVKWYRQAAEQGDLEAQCILGVSYQWGRGVAKDYEEAVKWYRRAAERGLALAQRNLGFMYRNGWGVDRDDAEAARWYRQAAERGELYAQDNLGNLYRSGLGVEKDYEEAVKWYRQAADRGLPEAQYNLGLMYLKGWGVPRDRAEAARWVRQSADNEFPLAQRTLGFLYESGLGVEKDLDEAVKWYRQAADKGDAEAEKRLKRLVPE